MSDEIVFDVLCTKVLDALRALGLGKFSIRNYYYEGMWPIIKVYRSEGVSWSPGDTPHRDRSRRGSGSGRGPADLGYSDPSLYLM